MMNYSREDIIKFAAYGWTVSSVVDDHGTDDTGITFESLRELRTLAFNKTLEFGMEINSVTKDMPEEEQVKKPHLSLVKENENV